MQFGVNTWVWVSPLGDADIARLVPQVASMGFDAIEFPIEIPDSYNYHTAGALARAAGLRVSVAAAMGPDHDLIHPDATIRTNGAAYVRHCIAAAAMGAPTLMGPMYSAVGRTWQMSASEHERDTAILVDTLRELAGYAHEHGVTLALEPLSRFETSFLNTAQQMIAVVDRVDHPACGMMLDTFHMNIEEQSAAVAIQAAGSRLKQFHACENDRGTPGAGSVQWASVRDALRAIGYDGSIVIESFTDQVQSIARAAAIWRPLAASQDDLARDGLRFLKTLLA